MVKIFEQAVVAEMRAAARIEICPKARVTTRIVLGRTCNCVLRGHIKLNFSPKKKQEILKGFHKPLYKHIHAPLNSYFIID